MSDANDEVRDEVRRSPTHSAIAILPTGAYRFKFIVDGQWVAAASSIYPTVTDTAGNVNNEVFVGAASWPFEWVRVPSAYPAGPPGRPRASPSRARRGDDDARRDEHTVQ